MCFLSLICGYFFLPELKGRSLEEVDVMFQAGLPLRKFNKYRSEGGVGAAISRLERQDSEGDDVIKAKNLAMQRENSVDE